MFVKKTQLEMIATVGAFLLVNACGQKAAFDETPVQAQVVAAGDSEAARQGKTNATVRSASGGDSGNLGSTTGQTTTGGTTTGGDPTPTPTPTPTPEPTPTPLSPDPAPMGDEPGGDPLPNGSDTDDGTPPNSDTGDVTDGDDTSGTTDGDDTSETTDGSMGNDSTGTGDSAGGTDGGTTDDSGDDTTSGGDGSGEEEDRQMVEANCNHHDKTDTYHIVTSGSDSINAKPGDLFYVHLTSNKTQWELNINVEDSASLTDIDASKQVYVCVFMTGARNSFHLNTGIDTVLEVKTRGKRASQTFSYNEQADAKVTVVEHD